MGLFDFFEDVWDTVSGEKEARHARWRQETREATIETRTRVIEFAYDLWSTRSKKKLSNFEVKDRQYAMAQLVLSDLAVSMATDDLSVTTEDFLFYCTSVERKSHPSKKGIKSRESFNARKIVEHARLEYPYEHSTTTYEARHDPFIAHVDKFMRKELKGLNQLLGFWDEFRLLIMEIKI